MRARLTAVALAVLMLPVSVLANETPEASGSVALEDSVARASYAIGYRMGSEVERNGTWTDPQALFAGLRDGLKSAVPALSDLEIDKVLTRAKRMLMKQTRDHRAAMARGLEYLERHREAEDVVCLPSGVQYATYRNGAGRPPTLEDKVRIRYRAMLVDGRVFHDSFAKPDAETVRVGDLIEGMGEALLRMTPGSRWRVVIPPLRAYETDGPLAYETLLIELELEAVEDSDRSLSGASDGQRVRGRL